MTAPFRLFAQGTNFWSLEDYAAVLEAVRMYQPETVLEFGPGSSTLALVEGGASEIDACEDQPGWIEIYRERLERRFAGVVVIPYTVPERPGTPFSIPAIAGKRYDFALVDGPFVTAFRPDATRFALERSAVVMAGTEDFGRRDRSVLRPAFEALAFKFGAALRYVECGSTSGGFAIFINKVTS